MAGASAKLAGAVEIPDLRTQDSKRYSLPDGQQATVVSRLRHYKRGGVWSEIDLRLIDQGGNVYRADKHDYVFQADSGGFQIQQYGSGKGIRFAFPSPPDLVTSNAAYWSRDGVVWKLQPRKVGLKTTATVSARRGPWTYHFDAQMLGGLAPPTVDANGNLSHPAFLIPRAYVDGADGSHYDCSFWRITGGQAEFDFDDTALPDSAFPYVIDPTTIFALAASADDGYVYANDTVYPPATAPTVDTSAASLSVERSSLGAPDYQVSVALLRFDTSSLGASASVRSATLTLYVETHVSGDGRDLTLEWYEPGTIGTEDYTDVAGITANTGVSLSSLTSGASNDIDLDNVEMISREGYSGLRAHISGDVPSSTNSVTIAAVEDVSWPEPQLTVVHGIAGAANVVESVRGLERATV